MAADDAPVERRRGRGNQAPSVLQRVATLLDAMPVDELDQLDDDAHLLRARLMTAVGRLPDPDGVGIDDTDEVDDWVIAEADRFADRDPDTMPPGMQRWRTLVGDLAAVFRPHT
jgi:hypothetical protein